jgi:predicted ATPase
LGEQFLRLAQEQDDSALLLTGHWLLGTPLCWLGEFVRAHEHFERNRALYDPAQHHDLAFHYALDPGSASRAYTACTLWTLGYPDQALRRGQEARVLAQQQAHPFSLTYVQLLVALASWLDRAWHSISDHTETLLAVAIEHGFPIWILAGTFMRGCALAALGQWDEGLAQMLQGQAAWRPTIFGGLYPVMLADAYGKMGRFEDGLMVLNEAQDAMATSGCRFMEAETYRLKGEFLLALPESNVSEVELCFHQAITIAQNQSAKSWELRAATSLAQLWQSQGKRKEASDLLAPVYTWFTEGFDTADLIDAKALLDELGV